MRRGTFVVAEALPDLRCAVRGREIAIAYLPPAARPRRRRRKKALEPAPLYPTHDQLLGFEPCWIHGCRGRKDLRVVEVVTPPIEIAGARLGRVLIPSRIAYQLVIESIDVGRELLTPNRLPPMSASVFSDAFGPRIDAGLPVGSRVRMRIRNVSRKKVWFVGAISVEVHAAPPEPILPPPAFGQPNGRHLYPLLDASPDQPFGWLAGPGSPLFWPAPAPAWVGPPSAPHDRVPVAPVSLEVSATSDLQTLSGAVGARVRILSTGAIFVCGYDSFAEPDGLTSVRSCTPGCVWRLEARS